MKKIILCLLLLLLLACEEDKPIRKEIEEKTIEIEEISEKIEYIEENVLKGLIYEVNDQLRIIDLDVLHRRMEDLLMDKIDLTVSIEEQLLVLEEVIYDELYIWRREVVHDVIDSSGDQVNADDYETIVSRTSIEIAFQVMLSYEKAYLKNRGE